MWRDFSKALRELWQTSSKASRSYRPDLHYMRGPGPKWHAKYGKYGTLAKTATPATPQPPELAGTAFRDEAERRA
jgi:hypothetical protein